MLASFFSPLEGATSLQISAFLAPFGPHVIRTVLASYRSRINRSRNGHRKRRLGAEWVSKSCSALVPSDWAAIGGALYSALISSGEPMVRPSRKPRSSLPPSTVEDGGGAIDPPGGDEGHDDITLRSVRCEVPISILTSMQHIPIVAFRTFVSEVAAFAVCVYVLNVDGMTKAKLLLPAYDCEVLRRVNTPPISVEVVRRGMELHVTCHCSASSLAAFPSAFSCPALHGGVCWHQASLRVPEVLDLLLAKAKATCSSFTGLPESNVICVVSIQRKVAQDADVQPLTSRALVYCFVASDLGTSANEHDGLLTLTRVRGELQVTCSACSRVRRGPRKAVNCAR